MSLRLTGVASLSLLLAAAVTPQRSLRAVAQTAANDSSGPGQWIASEGGEDPANLLEERVRPRPTGATLPVEQGAVAVAEGLKRLRTTASLLMIVAHPDDEDGGMLTYESRGQGARTGMLTLTRGEGGQNVMSGDFNDALGLVRTRELLAADRVMGVQQMFGTEVDFGFSKTKEEAFAQWTHQRVLYDAVRAVRLFRPLVVTSVFVGAPSDGHGQHQVSGEIAQEVFRAAGDPKVFPEMGLPVWSPAKVYARMPFAQVTDRGMYDYATGKMVPVRFENYVTGEISHTAPRATVTIPEGEQSALLGKSYVQFAREGLGLQKTQIGGAMRQAPAGAFDVGYTRYGARPGLPTPATESSFFEGLDTSLGGIARLAPSLRGDDAERLRTSLAAATRAVDQATAAFTMAHPEQSAEGLQRVIVALDGALAAAAKWNGVPQRERFDVLHELRIKRIQANDTLLAALGMRLRATVEAGQARVATPEAHLAVQTVLENGSGDAVTIEQQGTSFGESVRLRGAPADGTTAAHGRREATMDAAVVAHPTYTRPYYTRKDVEQPFYEVLDPRLRNAPTTPPALVAWATVRWRDVPLTLGAVVAVPPDGRPGEVEQPLMALPPVSVAVAPPVLMLPEGRRSMDLKTEVRTEVAAGSGGDVRLTLPANWTAQPADATFPAKAGMQAASFAVTAGGAVAGEQTVTATARYEGQSFREGFHPVGYPGIVHDELFTAATTRVHGIRLTIPPDLKVAYLPGTGDAVEDSLRAIGVRVTTVSVAEIAAGRLVGYDALVMGVRAYAAHADLRTATAALDTYMKGGGVVVAQYNTAEFTGDDAPYPLALGGAEKVVEERAPVRLLLPGEQALRWPNQLSERDFDGWVEERGHGFLGTWAPDYRALTEVHDEGQDPQRGGLLVAPVGRGAYVYCAYALYRQLPEGVPGAYRLLVNLISLGRRP